MGVHPFLKNFILFKSHKVRWAFYGAFLSLGSPAGLYVIDKYMFEGYSDILKVAYIYSTIGTLIVFSSFGMWAGNFIDKLDYYASHDLLTQLFNRRYMQIRLEEAFSFCKRYQKPFLICMLDLDYFKKVNDTYGHSVGDKVLRAVSGVLKAESRGSDIVARWGGEEFIIFCPETSSEQGVLLSNRIREKVMELSAQDLGFKGPQTISIGVVLCSPNESSNLNFILKELDSTLYMAKNQGRNKVVFQQI